jgi:putative 4-mercaptohistidine N1-methyltranferase
MNIYETERSLSEYLLFHYGKAEEVMPYRFGPQEALDYAVRCVTACVDPAWVPSGGRALDLGCAVGRSTFELARFCASSVGIDASRRFIRTAEHLRTEGWMEVPCWEEGEIKTRVLVRPPDGVERGRVRFEVGDAMALREDLGEFDVVLMANLIDRLSDPEKCLRQLERLVSKGGQLVITSPYTWMVEYTPRDRWLGGKEVDGKGRRTLEGLREILEPAFSLQSVKDLPFVIREHARKYQWSVAQATIWRRM